MSVKTTFAAAMLCLAALPAYAQTAAPAPAAAPATTDAGPADPAAKARWQACQPDVQKFCGTVDKSVKGAMKVCLESHASELSQPCTSARAERAAMEAAKGEKK